MSNLRKFSDINEVEALSSSIKFAADLKHFDILYVPNIFFFALSLFPVTLGQLSKSCSPMYFASSYRPW